MSKIKEFDRQVSETLKNADRFKGRYTEYLNISPKAKSVITDMDDNHNMSFAMLVYERNKGNLDKTALVYRGNEITYEELFVKVFDYAKSLKAMGYNSKSEIPACVSNSPEFIYLFLAANLIGAKLNVFGEWFDDEYTKFILNNSKSDYVFVSDDMYEHIASKIHGTNIKGIVTFSLSDSLIKNIDGKSINPYEGIDEKMHPGLFNNKVAKIKSEEKLDVFSQREFLRIGEKYNKSVVHDGCLNDPFAITYTSGTTNPGVPKAVLHSNRSYATISRFKDKDITNLTSMKGVSCLIHIPTYTHMNLCSIGDGLMQGCKICLEPVYDKDFFKYSAIMHQVNYMPGSQGFYYNLFDALEHDKDFVRLANYFTNDKYTNGCLPNLIAPTITGEGLDVGLEKYFNKMARKHKFGVSKLKVPATFCIGGGTGEASGVFTTLFKEYMSKLPPYVLHKDSLGLNALPFAEVRVVNEAGRYAKDNEDGYFVVKSPCDMLGYYYNEKDFPKLHIDDPYVETNDGRRWLKISNVGHRTSCNSFKFKDRLNNNIELADGTVIPLYKIKDCILRDTKNILCGSLVKVNDELVGESLMMHIMLQPDKKKAKEDIILDTIARLKREFPREVLDKIYIRVRRPDEIFAVAPSGKRDNNALVSEGYTDNCVSVCYLMELYRDRFNKGKKGKVLTR